MSESIKLPELAGTLAALPDRLKKTIEKYGMACAATAKARPAPCANLCEARAIEIEIRQLKGQNEALVRDRGMLLEQMTKANRELALLMAQEPFIYRKEPHKGWPEYSETNDFSDGYGGGMALYAAPVPAEVIPESEICALIDNVRKWGIENTGNEPSVSCFHRSLDNLVSALLSAKISDELKQSLIYAKLADTPTTSQNITAAYEAGYAQGKAEASPAGAVPDGLNELIAACRQIGFPVVSDGMKSVIDDMQTALRRVQNSICKPSPRITEQDAREIVCDYENWRLSCRYIGDGFDAWTQYLFYSGAALLNKLNAKPEGQGGAQ